MPGNRSQEWLFLCKVFTRRILAEHSTQPTELTQLSHVSSLYNFGKDRIQITISKISSIIVCLFVSAETFIDSAATVWFPQVYTFSYSYPSTRLLNTQQWLVSTNRISVATCLPFRFLETSTYHSIKMVTGEAVRVESGFRWLMIWFSRELLWWE
jgi:hypothetical protein